MRKFLITFICVIVVMVLLGVGCFGFYLGNQQEIDARFNQLLDERINEYVETNRQEFIASVTPYIGQNGNWWIGDTDTGCPVTVEGRPGMSAYAVAVANGFTGSETEWLNSIKGTDGKDGTDGQTPYIGTNNNWWIGDKDTGCLAVIQDKLQIIKLSFYGGVPPVGALGLNDNMDNYKYLVFRARFANDKADYGSSYTIIPTEIFIQNAAYAKSRVVIGEGTEINISFYYLNSTSIYIHSRHVYCDEFAVWGVK